MCFTFRFLHAAVLLVGLIIVRPANADTRVALVIGNGAYQNVPTLPNPVNDANDIAASLKQLGFDVTTLTDAKFDEIRRALIPFGQRARGADFAVVFFAGHGMEIGGENWLIPTDAHLASDLDVENETIGLRSLTRAVSTTGKLGLVILDACRNNPFVPKMQMQRTTMTRAVERGFVRVEPNDNVLVAYSARDGTTANDGTGRNSPFTSSLLKNIKTPGLEVRFLFAAIRDEVMAATQRQQQPFLYGSLSKELVYLNTTIPLAVATPGPVVAPSKNVVPPSSFNLSSTGPDLIVPAPAGSAAGVRPTEQHRSPSFRCERTLSVDEQTICKNSVLSSLDFELDSVFSVAKQTAMDRAGLIAIQKLWIARRRACVADEACIASLYRSRIAELRTATGNPSRPTFSCSGALREDERTICASTQLSSLDQQLDTAFNSAKSRLAKPELIREQKNWLARRGSCLGDSGCIAALYRQRISELNNAR